VAEAHFFDGPEAWRAWLAEHHATEREVEVGFYRKATGRQTMTWSQAVDEALCFGWIDSVMHPIDEVSYRQRFTPRKPRSTWSRINIAKVEALTAEGRMAPAGMAAFEARSEANSGIYSFEQAERPDRLPPEYDARLRENAAAAADFDARPPSFRRAAVHWVISAKREETRQRRLAQLIERAAEGRPPPPLDY
jgi:uncharacterized protein YdeI (YjbR/CyaY-like superfamily)